MGQVSIWNSDNVEASLYVTIKSPTKKRFFLVAKDSGKPNSDYAKREMEVEGERTIFFSFPITPREMTIGVYNIADRNDKNFQVSFEERPLRKYNIWLDEETRDFLKLDFYFSQVCGFKPSSPKGTLYQTADGKFNIKYYPVIIDYMSGKAMNTPARIGHTTGTIDASKVRFDRYTFAERVVILLHEFSHKYKNPKMGLAINNETGADINALYIYLGLGFSKIDAINVFANVFLKAQTPGNIKRMRAIIDYIQKFENQEFAQLS